MMSQSVSQLVGYTEFNFTYHIAVIVIVAVYVVKQQQQQQIHRTVKLNFANNINNLVYVVVYG